MSVLLYLPGILVVLVKRNGLVATLRLAAVMVSIQVLLGRRFLSEYPRAYLTGAFDLGRVFLYKWTVNWRFVSEESFLSPGFALALLLGHLSALLAFGWFRWTRRDGGPLFVLKRALLSPTQPASPVVITADGKTYSLLTLRFVCLSYSAEVTTILFTSNLIGILFARSLHYQFYSWYAYQVPFLTWRSRYPVIVKLVKMFLVVYIKSC